MSEILPTLPRMQPDACIAIGTPSGGTSPDEFQESMWRMKFGTMGRRIEIIPIRCQGSSIAHNQNNIVKAAREISGKLKADGITRGLDAIFFFENDESFLNAEEVIHRLWSHDKDIVGCTYCYKDPARIRVMGVELDGQPIDWLSLYHRPPLTKVMALPIGALMIKMKVFDALDQEGFHFKNEDTGEEEILTEMPIFQHDIHYGLKLVRTTDYVFCTRAAKAGFDIWLDAPLSLEIEHWGKHPYSLPHPAKMCQQLATLQAVADAHAKASEEPGAAPHLQKMAEDLYAVAADMARNLGAFAPTAPEERLKKDDEEAA